MKKVLCFAAAAMALFAACQKTTVVYDNGGQQEIAFFAVNKTATKAPVSDVTFPADYDMMVAAYLAEGGEAAGNYFAGTKFTRAPQGTTPETYLWTGQKYWPLTYSKINFLAVAQPSDSYDGVGTVNTTFNATNYANSATVVLANNQTVQDDPETPTDDEGVYSQFDLMYAAGLGDHSDSHPYPEVNMIFNHALSWINFNVATNVDNIDVTVNSIQLDRAYYGGTLTLNNANYASEVSYSTSDAITVTTDSWANRTAQTNNVFVPNNNATANAEGVQCTVSPTASPASFGNGLLVVPTKYNTNYPSFTINYTITDGAAVTTYNYTHAFADDGDFEWEPGKKYIYNIIINLNEIKVNPGVEVWDDTDDNGTPAIDSDDTPWGGDVHLGNPE